MEICFGGLILSGRTQPSTKVFAFVIVKSGPPMPSAPVAVPSVFCTFRYLRYKLSPPFSRLSLCWLDSSLGYTGALEFHVFHWSTSAFDVFALGLGSTVSCLGAFSSGVHPAAADPSRSTSSVFRGNKCSGLPT